ncbi:Protein phosphatase methylesterase 1 [Vitis vinifera]|uniref:Protein phosphatase methylesterase 1 n=2 Tax=Vitis vinifera TaxID=29760 RepID=A0A438HPA2_VITVI|nr:Protein phosphatase methylesterase 1 [Vitis vinifera]
MFCLDRLSFALAASKIKEKARVVAMDLRGHGKSSTENELDLSIETLCNDVLAVLKKMYGDSPPAIVLVGHRESRLDPKGSSKWTEIGQGVNWKQGEENANQKPHLEIGSRQWFQGGLDLSAEGALWLGGLSASSEPLFPIAWPFFLFNALFGFGLEFEMRKEKMEYNRFSFMGGSVAVHLAAKKVLSSLCGLVVVDVVESTRISGNGDGFLDSYAENPLKQDAAFFNP